MMTLAGYLAELGPLLEQLEAALAGGASDVSPGQLFGWRTRARLIEDKLHQAAKPPRVKGEGEIEDVVPPAPALTGSALGRAQQALPHANGLREALQNRKLKVALDAARAIERLVA